MNKVGQISSPNKGSYDQEAYPTEEDFINEWEAIKADFESIDEDIFIGILHYHFLESTTLKYIIKIDFL